MLFFISTTAQTTNVLNLMNQTQDHKKKQTTGKSEMVKYLCKLVGMGET